MSRLVVHCKKEKYDVYIGRAVPRSGLKASVWGNPFVIGKDGTREEVIVKYRAWLLANPELLAKLPELKGLKRVIMSIRAVRASTAPVQ